MCRTKITVQSGAERHPKDAEAAALLTVIFVGSRLERREDSRSYKDSLSGRDGGRPGRHRLRALHRAAD